MKKRVAWNKGIPIRPEAKEKMINAMKGKHFSPDTEFKKGHKLRVGMKHSLEARKNISKGHLGIPAWNKGKHHSCATKQKLRLINLGKTLPLKVRLKIGKANKGKNRGPNNGMWKGGQENTARYVCITTAKGKWVPLHRFIMEKFLDRKLKSQEAVHHINGIKNDNRLENLMVCATNSEHMKQHTYKNKNYFRKKQWHK